MDKSKLRTGMMVKIKTGDKFLVIIDTIGYNHRFKGESILLNNDGTSLFLNRYNEKLEHITIKELNIVEIRVMSSITDIFEDWNYDSSQLIWEREYKTQYIVGNHFGNNKGYIWKTNIDDLNIGDIVEVETSKGNQLVQVKRLFYSDKSGKYKNVIRKVVI